MRQLSLLEHARILEPGLNDRDRIEAIAADTIRELEERPPINLAVVASYRDIGEIRVESIPCDGMLTPAPGKLVMSISSNASAGRRRFTGFHEVGHTFQPGYRDEVQRRCSNISQRRRGGENSEALADAAAAELLLPEAFFAADVRETQFGLRGVTDLSDAYEASIQATAYRAVRFSPEPRLFMVLEPGLRKEQRGDPHAIERLRVRSTATNGDWPFIPRNKSIADEGALARAWEGEVINETTTLCEIGIADDRPVEVSARRYTYNGSDGPRSRVLALYRGLA